MAVSSLSRMTVPLGSDQSANNQGLLMPKLKYRFRVLFENFGISTPKTELTKQVMTFDRPSVEFDDITINLYNSKMRLAGKHTWQDVTVEMRDDASGSISRLIGEQLQRQMDFMEQSSASSGIDYKFLTRCEMLDGGNGANEPQTLETWELYGCYVTSANYNQLDYATSDVQTVSMTLRFDNALQTPLGDGVGTSVGRTLGETVTG